jgi:hypothetical protein
LKNIASPQTTFVKQIEESSNTKKGKDRIIDGLQSEVPKITNECKREIDNTKAMFEMSLPRYENTISNLQEELKRRLDVLNIPPLQTASNLVVDESKKSLKEK